MSATASRKGKIEGLDIQKKKCPGMLI